MFFYVFGLELDEVAIKPPGLTKMYDTSPEKWVLRYVDRLLFGSKAISQCEYRLSNSQKWLFRSIKIP